ncbi:Tigger transposable element-derived protein 1-like 102, partial [Homarus americanus]
MASVEPVGGGGQPGVNGNPPKHPELPKAKREYRVGKKHAKYSLADMAKVVEYFEKGMKTSEVRRLTGTPESTIRTLKQKKETIKQQMDTGKKYFGTHERMSADTSEYRKIIAITEAYLSKWLARRVKEDASVSWPELREQARVIYSAVCKKKNISSPPSFKASVGWLANFKKRCQVKLAKYHGEIAFADISGADSFPASAKQIVEDGGYSYEQMYNCDETGFYWKKSPTTIYMHKTEKQAKGTKLARDRFSVLFTCNASSSHKMKPRPSSTRAHILTVKQFWKKFNIRNAVDTMVYAWHEINVPTITHAWTPLFPHLKVKCGVLAETVESVRHVGGEFDEVTEDTVMNLVTFNSEENITEMLENDSDSSSYEEGQPEVIEKLTTAKLAKILTGCSDMKKSFRNSLKMPLSYKIHCPTLTVSMIFSWQFATAKSGKTTECDNKILPMPPGCSRRNTEHSRSRWGRGYCNGTC